jgi:hypothetical protein
MPSLLQDSGYADWLLKFLAHTLSKDSDRYPSRIGKKNRERERSAPLRWSARPRRRDMFHLRRQRRSTLVLHNGPMRRRMVGVSSTPRAPEGGKSCIQLLPNKGEKCRTSILAGAEKQATSISPSDRDKERKSRTGRLHHHSQGSTRVMPLQFGGYFIPKKKGKGGRVHSVSS